MHKLAIRLMPKRAFGENRPSFAGNLMGAGIPGMMYSANRWKNFLGKKVAPPVSRALQRTFRSIEPESIPTVPRPAGGFSTRAASLNKLAMRG